MTQQRSNEDIRADQARKEELRAAFRRRLEDVKAGKRGGLIDYASVREEDDLNRRLAADVEPLLARAERAEAGAAALLVKVAAVEALLPNTDEQFPIFPCQIRDALGADPSGYILIPVAALATAGLSLQEEQE